MIHQVHAMRPNNECPEVIWQEAALPPYTHFCNGFPLRTQCTPHRRVGHRSLAAGRSAANLPHAAAAVDRWNRQTDGQIDGQTDA